MKKILIISGVLLASLSMSGCAVTAATSGVATKSVKLSDGSLIDCVISSNSSGTSMQCIESTRTGN